MDIMKEVLDKIKCCECENYLLAAPVFITTKGEAVCRVCKESETFRGHLVRNKQYEALASLAKFPCKYQDEGCKETNEFYEGDPPAHELACEYKQYLCPVMPTGQCEWTGRRSQILQHCQEQHSNQVLTSPCALKHDITKPSLASYLLQAYQFLFLLHTKVCIISGKIFHSVRVFGDPKLTDKFKYTLTIKKGELLWSMPGQVAAEGCLAIQEDSSVATGINGLLEFFKGYEDTEFHISISKSINFVKCPTEDCTEVVITNVNADGTDMTVTKCNKCATTKRSCKNLGLGCLYTDVDYKCIQHETYFCQYLTKCPLCEQWITNSQQLFAIHICPQNENTKIKAISEHYLNSHLSNKNSLIFNLHLSRMQNKIEIVCSEIGYLILCINYNNNSLIININSSLELKDVCKYDCHVKFEPQKIDSFGFGAISTNTKIFSTQHQTGTCDWTLSVNHTDLNYKSWNLYFFINKTRV